MKVYVIRGTHDEQNTQFAHVSSPSNRYSTLDRRETAAPARPLHSFSPPPWQSRIEVAAAAMISGPP